MDVTDARNCCKTRHYYEELPVLTLLDQRAGGRSLLELEIDQV